MDALTSLGPDRSRIERARQRLTTYLPPTPLLPLDLRFDRGLDGVELLAKLENLQPVGSFKIRGALNALLEAAEAGTEAPGVWTASAGNMGYAVAWAARELGWPASVVVPDSAPQAKVGAIRRTGADVERLPWPEWWRVVSERSHPPLADWLFVHPYDDPHVIAGHATAGLEIADQAPDADTVVVPVGGGGLVSGIAAGLRLRGVGARVVTAECDAAAPVAAALEAGRPVDVEKRLSFVDGIGANRVLDGMWPLLREYVDRSVVVSEKQAAAAVRLVVDRLQVVAEGAGAVGVAAVTAGEVPGPRIVCVVSGGRIDPGALATVLSGGVPRPSVGR